MTRLRRLVAAGDDLRAALDPDVRNASDEMRLVAAGDDLRAALADDDAPPEVYALLDTLAALLRPTPREQIKSPADVAALLMVEMSHLDQEELRVINLDAKHRIQRITTVYRGSVNSAQMRIAEVFKDATLFNCLVSEPGGLRRGWARRRRSGRA